jgi:hypothetical protein
MLRGLPETHCARGVGDDVLEQEIAKQEMAQVVRPYGELKTLRFAKSLRQPTAAQLPRIKTSSQCDGHMRL